MKAMHALLRGLICSTLLAAAGAWAQYPVKPVQLLIPAPAGDGSDVLGRVIAQALTASLGQPVVVDNKPGAGGSIAAAKAAKAAPDGYTLLMGNGSSHGVTPSLYPKLSYDTLKDFAPITLLATAPNVLVVSAALPVATLAEFIAYAKARPGLLNMASGGNGSLSHLSAQWFMGVAGIELVHVPYKGASPALTDVAAGHAAAMVINIPSAQPLLQTGKLKALATTGALRAATLPNLPTIKEAGFADYETTSWFGLFAPAGTPVAVLERLNAASTQALQNPQVQEQLAARGLSPASAGPAQLASFMRAEIVKYNLIIRSAKIVLD